MEQGNVRRLFDFRKVSIPEQLFELNYSKAVVEQELEGIREKFLTIEAISDPVKSGDIVTLELPAAETATAGKLQINVGKHFYDQAFEDSLVGLLPGTAVTLPRRDQYRSAVLSQIKRRVFPPLTDKLAAQLGIQGVTTLDDYRMVIQKKFIAEDKRKKTDAIMNMVFRAVVSQSEFGDMTEDVDKAVEAQKARLCKMAESSGKTYEEILERAVPPKYETIERREAYIRDTLEFEVRKRAVSLYAFRQDGNELSPSGFAAFKQFCIDAGMKREQVEQDITYQIYCDSAPFHYYQDTVMNYYEKYFKEVPQK